MGKARACVFGRAKADESERPLEFAAECLGGIVGKIAWKDCRFALAVKGFVSDRFVFLWHAGDAGKLLASLLYGRLAGGADRRQSGDIDLSAIVFSPCCRIGDQELEDALEPVVARVVKQIGLG